MSQRITQKDLECLVRRINLITKQALEPYTKADGKMTANKGNYHLDYAYSGVKLVQMVSDGGGISDISRNGYGTKKELFRWMDAYCEGLLSNHRQENEIAGRH